MLKINKLISLIIIGSIVFLLASCSQKTEDISVISKTPPDLNIMAEIYDTTNGWIADKSGMFSYKEYHPIKGIDLYFDTKVGCPDNMVLYKSEVDGNKMYGYMDTDFNVLSEPINERPMIFQYGYALLSKDYRHKVMDRAFNIVDERGFSSIVQGDSILYIDWHYYPVDEPRIIGGIDRDTYLIPYTITHNKETGELLPIPLTGFKKINDVYDKDVAPDDNFVIPANFIVTNGFSDGLAPIIYNDGFAFINEEGAIVIDNSYDSYYQLFIDGVAIVSTHDREINGELESGLCIIDKEGNELTDLYICIESYKDGYAACCIKGGQWTYFDTKGKSINEVDYFEVNTFSEGIGRVRFQDGYSFIDTDGNQIGGSLFENASDFSDGMAAVQVNGLWGYIGKDGLYKIDSKYRSASSFDNGFAIVKVRVDSPGVIIDEMENRYLEELGITRLTRFNDDGYAIALTNRIVNGIMETTYYMIHSENYDR